MFAPDVDLIHVQRQLEAAFNLDELQALAYDLDVEYENLAGDTRAAKTRELVKHCYRHGLVARLLGRCAELRPDVEWHQPPKVYGARDLPAEWVEPLQRLYQLVKAFNRNRHLPFSDARTREGDEIAFEMREAAPFLFNQFDVGQWLSSSSIGKRLAAVKYLDWLQDPEYLDNLLARLVTERPFMQLHILLSIDSLLDQLDRRQATLTSAALTAYKLARPDPDLEYWRQRILTRLSGQG